MSQPKGYVSPNYLQAAGEFVNHLKQRTYSLMQLLPGQKVLDVGCGPASDTLQLGRLVGPTGIVFGVDYDQAMIKEAEKRTDQAGLAGWVTHKCADSGSLPFETGEFDACRSERLFQHLHDPKRTLSEMIRVTKPGGRVVVLDTDWGSFSIDSSEVDIERRLVRFFAETQLHNGFSGRQLYHLYKQQNLTDVTVKLCPLNFMSYGLARHLITLFDTSEPIALAEGLVTESEIQRWHASLEQADAQDAFFCSVTQVVVVGRKL